MPNSVLGADGKYYQAGYAVADVATPTTGSIGETTVTVSGNIDITNAQAGGTQYTYVSQNASETDQAIIDNAQDSSVVNATGNVDSAITGLTAGANYYPHRAHQNTSGWKHSESGAQFTTTSGDGSTHSFTGLPLDANGWTDLDAMITSAGYSDARIMYVASDGNDGTATVYSQSQVNALGGTPTSPESGVNAFATIGEAWSNLRDNYPDVILIRRGETFRHNFSPSQQGGRNKTERRIVAAYGDGQRPVIELSSGITQWTSAQNYVWADLDLYSYQKDPEHPEFDAEVDTDWTIEYGAGETLIEGVRMRFMGLIIQEEAGEPEFGYPFNIALRRSSIANNYRITGHVQGAYIYTPEPILIEESVFDANGYLEGVSEPTWFRRNMYIHQTPNVSVRKTISARGAVGDQLRLGGLWEQNLSLKQTWTLGLGHPKSTAGPYSATVRFNVTLDGNNIGEEPYGGAQGPRGEGYTIGEDSDGVTLHDNIIAHNVTGEGNFRAIYFSHEERGPIKDVTIRNNIVYDWEGPGLTFSGGPTVIGSVVQDNDFVMTKGGSVVQGYQSADHEIDWSGNRYYSSDEASAPFNANGSDLTPAQWEALTGESVTIAEPSYPHPDRTITTYMAALGETGLTYQQALDLFLKRAIDNDKANWSSQYTSVAVINYVREGFGLSSVPAED